MAKDYQDKIKSISEKIIDRNKIDYSSLAELMEDSKEVSKMFVSEDFFQQFIAANPQVQHAIEPLKLMIDSYRAEAKLIKARNKFREATKSGSDEDLNLAATTYIDTVKGLFSQTDIFMKVFGAIGIMNRPTEILPPKGFGSKKAIDVYSQFCQLFVDLPSNSDLQILTRVFSIMKNMQIAYFDEYGEAIKLGKSGDYTLADAVRDRSHELQKKLLQLVYEAMEKPTKTKKEVIV